MGDPAIPPQSERLRRVTLARAIVEAVEADESVAEACSLKWRYLSIGIVTPVPPVEELAFALAQEIVMLRAELAEARGESA